MTCCLAASLNLSDLGFLLLFIVVGCAVMGYALRQIVEGCRAAHWPHTTGTVMSLGSGINAEQDREVVVRYSYTVDDRTYEGNRVHPVYLGVPVEDESVRKAVEAALAPGKKVRVYYRADDPARSTLVFGFFSRSLFPVFWGSGFAILPLGMLVVAAIPEAGGTVAYVAGLVVFAVTGLGFLISWSLGLWFGMKGNRDIATGITFEG
ncbi:MAG TPA: DUF3592 domain-containing protein [Planctomycetaceae bacterium]|nr:DUF3592 domain-containing protein [Planctomycetaceae bacterium]